MLADVPTRGGAFEIATADVAARRGGIQACRRVICMTGF
jgi:hypothetical protein